jgi:hypothetical protein
MTMSWMETIRFTGLDLMVATVLAAAILDAAARVLRSAWGRIPRDATTEVGKQAASEWDQPECGAVQTASIRSTIVWLQPVLPGASELPCRVGPRNDTATDALLESVA